MITKLSNNAHRQATKAYKFNRISNNRLILSFKEYIDFIKRKDITRRPRVIRHYGTTSKQFNRLANRDTFANSASDYRFSLAKMSFSLASQKWMMNDILHQILNA